MYHPGTAHLGCEFTVGGRSFKHVRNRKGKVMNPAELHTAAVLQFQCHGLNFWI